MNSGTRRGGRCVAIVVAGLLVGLPAIATSAGAVPGEAAAPVRATAQTADVVELRPLTTSADRRIVDDLGRDVLLRGANVNSLGEYWQGVPELPATMPMTDADWDAMAARGFSVVRLLVTWSRIEPERDVIDQTYLDQVEAHVDAAAARGIYTVIDMHQDAYSAFVFTTDPTECSGDTRPAKGWDGAPEWATLTDGLSTCITGDRNSSPAVTQAWNNFYDDVDGIRTEFTESWAAVAERFAGRPEVAGYDLLNEPDASRPSAELTPVYEDLLRETATAIRTAEAGAPFDHLLIVEPALPAGNGANGLVIPDPNRIGLGTEGVVASVHNYSEIIAVPGFDFTIEGLNDLILTLAEGLGVATWGGEYGFFDFSDATLAKARRYAADEDANALGGAWWQWRQSCGDPHTVQWQDGEVVSPPGVVVHLNPMDCPSNTELAGHEPFLDILGRGYPRATPGRITSLASDPETGVLSLLATASADDVGQQLVVWSPTLDDSAHQVKVQGLTDVRSTAVAGGRIITADVTAVGDYQLAIGTDLVSSAPGPQPVPTPARPVSGSPDFTG